MPAASLSIRSLHDPVVLLVGGLGTRLKDTIGDMPKPLAPVQGRPFLAWLLDELFHQGFTQILLSGCHGAEKISEFLKYYPVHPPHKVTLVVEPQLLGTGGAVQHCIASMHRKGPFFVCNGDTMIPGGLAQLLQASDPTWHQVMGVLPMKHPDRYGLVEWNPHTHRVDGFLEKQKAHEGYINTGMYGFHTDAFYAPTPSSLEHDVLPHYIRHLQLKAVPIKASFIDIGIPKDYHAFCAYDRNIISTSDPKDGTTTSKDWAEDP